MNADVGPSFMVYTDDSTIYGELDHETRERYVQGNLKELSRYECVFDAIAALIYLPVAFIDEIDSVHVTEFGTSLSATDETDRLEGAIANLGADACPLSRSVRCFPRQADNSNVQELQLAPADISYYSQGFWKTLPPGQVGEDKEGHPIVGRTWVTRIESWNESSTGNFLARRPSSVVTGPDPGTIYVVRSPANEPNLHKIGLTRINAEKRAKELSGTSTALPFGVLASWEVGDCAKMESRIHTELAAYRVNPKREFFLIELNQLIATIHSNLRLEE